MKFELNEYHRNAPDEDLIADLKRVAQELRKDAITMDEYDERGKYCSETLRKKFKGWFNALGKAGLQKTKNLNILDEELFQNLEDVWGKVGRQPNYAEMHAPLSKFSSRTYQKRFGTWRKALERFVKHVNDEQDISSEDAIKNLRVEPATKHKTTRSINWRLRFLVMRRDNFKCKSCGRSPATDQNIVLHVDHVKAWANGGETIFENLQTLCSVCNIREKQLGINSSISTRAPRLYRDSSRDTFTFESERGSHGSTRPAIRRALLTMALSKRTPVSASKGQIKL